MTDKRTPARKARKHEPLSTSAPVGAWANARSGGFIAAIGSHPEPVGALLNQRCNRGLCQSFISNIIMGFSCER